MKEVYHGIEMCSRNDVSVLILGETGTGKELVARAIHESSQSSSDRFVAINCTAIPKDLIESELFGHERGAFTHATERRIGKFELAGQGTLLLDEIGDMDMRAQVKLLRVLEEREFNRVGGNRGIRFDARVIATTNQSLQSRIKEGEFRRDLYYRITEFVIRLPSLQERREDIPRLAEYFLRLGEKRFKKEKDGFTDDAIQKLMEYHWPGNVRELKNVINRALITSKGPMIEGRDIVLEPDLSPSEGPWLSLPSDLPLVEVERIVIERMLMVHGGNKAKVAQVLGIGLSTLYEKLKRFRQLPKGAIIQEGVCRE
jgi:DNA-binding NtrC family response regulator